MARLAPHLALIPLVALAACAPRRVPTEAMLHERGLTQTTVSAEPWLFGPCDWSEPYTAHFAGRFDGAMVDGVICAVDETAEGARLVAVRRPRFARGTP